MKNFLLSRNYNFPFTLFGIQHIIMILVTISLFIFIYVFRKKIYNMSDKQFKKIRVIMALIILINMLTYRISYMYYGIYQVKIHLSLYYCHIVNYLFVIALWLNNKSFYKIIYALSWSGAVWTIFFPDLFGGIDCFIFYSSFISHNLLLVFITTVLNRKIDYNFLDFIKGIITSVAIVLVTYLINYDFGTKFNTPVSILGKYIEYSLLGGYDILLILAMIGSLIGLFIIKLYQRSFDVNQEKGINV